MKTKLKRLLCLLLTLVLIFSLAACAKKSETPMPDMAPEATGSYGNGSSGKGANPGVGEEKEQSSRKIIMNAKAAIRVTSIHEAVAKAEEQALKIGGYIKSSYANDTSGSVVLMIPTGNLDAFLLSLGDYGKILNKSKTSEDVTDVYFDTEVRIRNLEAEIETMRALLAKNGWKVSEILEIEKEIRRLVDELEILKASITNMDRLVQFSTLDIEFLLEQTVIEDVDTDSFGYNIKIAFKYGVDALYGLVTFLTSVVVFLVPLLPLVLLGYLIWRFAIKPLVFRKKNKANKGNKLDSADKKEPIK